MIRHNLLPTCRPTGRPNCRFHFVDAPPRAPVSFTLGAWSRKVEFMRFTALGPLCFRPPALPGGAVGFGGVKPLASARPVANVWPARASGGGGCAARVAARAAWRGEGSRAAAGFGRPPRARPASVGLGFGRWRSGSVVPPRCRPTGRSTGTATSWLRQLSAARYLRRWASQVQRGARLQSTRRSICISHLNVNSKTTVVG